MTKRNDHRAGLFLLAITLLVLSNPGIADPLEVRALPVNEFVITGAGAITRDRLTNRQLPPVEMSSIGNVLIDANIVAALSIPEPSASKNKNAQSIPEIACATLEQQINGEIATTLCLDSRGGLTKESLQQLKNFTKEAEQVSALVKSQHANGWQQIEAILRKAEIEVIEVEHVPRDCPQCTAYVLLTSFPYK